MSTSSFFERPGYKNFMSKVYGFGAAVVILGALFKILHLPGASMMLIAGLGTESLIFFLSAFEPPHEMPDWSLVYPELVGLEPRETGGGGGGGGSELAALVSTGALDQASVDKLASGIQKLGDTSHNLADISDATAATQQFVDNMRHASDSFGKLETANAQSSAMIEQSATNMAQSYGATATMISEAGSQFANSLSVADLSAQTESYQQNLSTLNNNLASVNSIYELQLKSSQAQAEASQQLVTGIADMKSQLDSSVDNARQYKENMAQLSQTVGELNSIYGNMLSAMNR